MYRVHDAALGRWWQVDPKAEYLMGMSPFCAMNNNPITYYDPDGDLAPLAIYGIAAVVGGGINVWRNWDHIQQNGLMSGIQAFAIGAVSGMASAATGGAVAAALPAATTLTGAALSAGAVGMSAGAVDGLMTGVMNSTVQGASFGNAWTNGFNNAVSGALWGFGTGVGVIYGAAALGKLPSFTFSESASNITADNCKNICNVATRETFSTTVYPSQGGGNLATGATAAARTVSQSASNSTKALTNFYPPNNGALGKWSTEYLTPGTIIDRYGSGFGRYFSPQGTPLNMRALPPGNTGALNTFKVVKPFPVQSSTVAPAYGKIGLGRQYLSPVNANTLLKREIIIPF